MEYEACQSEAAQGNKQATQNRNQARRRRITCYCGERLVLATSSTVENPGQRFWGCVNFGVRLEKNAAISYKQNQRNIPHKFQG
ncbi:hypothetical protein Ahy_A10g048248 [Arachis hypogaea]|uniref:Uncharacterized protein n=1 Tax=Arachis hypogaea TaxID=3818 RepID=A0A445B4L2_ARAHY|nr:hypothetical protein Ahy_A10g048248 [Arachis hypogaea]